MFYLDDKTSWNVLSDGVKHKVMTWSDKLMMVCVHFAKGAVGTQHKHAIHDQIAYLATVRFEVTIDGKTKSPSTAKRAFLAPVTPTAL